MVRPRVRCCLAASCIVFLAPAPAHGEAASSRTCPAGATCEPLDEDEGALKVSLLQKRRSRASGDTLRAEALSSEAMLTEQKLAFLERAFAAVKGSGTYFDPFATPGEYIENAFKDVTGMGREWPSNKKVDSTWEECTAINWTKVASLENDGKIKFPGVADMMKELHVEECYPGPQGTYADDPTCVALRTAIKASIDMEPLFPAGPKFANYSVVAWGKLPSWVNGSVTNLDYSQPMPVQASLVNANGVLGYGICDILRTVLTQSANQMSTGTCSYVASVAALSHKAPAQAIKLGTRLLWTGHITSEMSPACPKIFEQQPGLIPFPSHGHWMPDFYSNAEEAPCTGNAVDCAAAKGRPNQNVGLTLMWSQTLISNWMLKNWGFCLNNSVRAGLTYPGQSKADAAIATQNQGGWYNSMAWECNTVLDPKGGTCKLLVNPNTCADFSYEECTKKLELEPAPELQSQVFDPLLMKYRSEAWSFGYLSKAAEEAYVVPKMKEALKDYPPLLEYTDLLKNLSSKANMSMFEIHGITGPEYPSFTEELLNKTCDAFTNMLVIDATVLSFALKMPEVMADLRAKDLPFFGNYRTSSGASFDKSSGCNHAVYLEHCDHENNNYVIWTWGTRVNLTKQFLLGWPTDQPSARATKGPWTWNTGSLCASIVADQITV